MPRRQLRRSTLLLYYVADESAIDPETADETERNARMAEILKYNEEDLAATWAIFEWLRGKLLG